MLRLPCNCDGGAHHADWCQSNKEQPEQSDALRQAQERILWLGIGRFFEVVRAEGWRMTYHARDKGAETYFIRLGGMNPQLTQLQEQLADKQVIIDEYSKLSQKQTQKYADVRKRLTEKDKEIEQLKDELGRTRKERDAVVRMRELDSAKLAAALKALAAIGSHVALFHITGCMCTICQVYREWEKQNDKD